MNNRTIHLQKLFEAIKNSDNFQINQVKKNTDIVVRGIAWDYKKVVRDGIYFALTQEEFQEPHISVNSLAHVNDAIKAGAAVIFAEEGNIPYSKNDDYILVEIKGNLNQCMALACREFYDHPFNNMTVIGITGTKGKTTTCQIAEYILRCSGFNTGYIGTIGVIFSDTILKPGLLSNPTSTDLHEYADMMRAEGVNCLLMEITSHGAYFDRNHGIPFSVGVFTNFSSDHMDFHKTEEHYLESKLKFFREMASTGDNNRSIVINSDDPKSTNFIDAFNQGNEKKCNILRYGISSDSYELTARNFHISAEGTSFIPVVEGRNYPICKIKHPGQFNLLNSLAAMGIAISTNITATRSVELLEASGTVKGRFERVPALNGANVFVDYAHTEGSLENSLNYARQVCKGKLICVFGCGGDRDKSKRPKMGFISAKLADFCFVTTDNPRTENPEIIIDEIVKGIPDFLKNKIERCLDRTSAIRKALALSQSGDVVLIAGKGHEDYQVIGKRKLHYSDREEVERFYTPVSEIPLTQRVALVINREALRHNFRLIAEDAPPKLKFFSTIKDNAVGVGMFLMANEALRFGAEVLCVSNLDEALEIRKLFPSARILVLGERLPEEFGLCVENDLSIQFQQLCNVEALNIEAQRLGKLAKVHLKVDSGMSRYGIKPDQFPTLFSSVRSANNIVIEGVFTHFAQSDEADKSFAKSQLDNFKVVTSFLDEIRFRPEFIHASNSGGYLDIPEAHFDAVRIGILPSGIYPSKVCRRININGRQLLPVMELKTRVILTRNLCPGDKIGYGMRYEVSKKPMRTAILPIGYGDGYPRLRNNGWVIINGKKACILGGISLDAMIVDITNIENVNQGTSVTLVGSDGQEKISWNDLAEWGGSVTYDVMTRLGGRVYRMEMDGELPNPWKLPPLT